MRVSSTGIRDGELITASASGSQVKGTILRIHGVTSEPGELVYPPTLSQVEALTETQLRDALTEYPFFESMETAQDRRSWLRRNARDVKGKGNYLDAFDIYAEIIQLDGPAFVNTLTPSQIERLQQGNTTHPKGWWRLSDITDMFPRKPGSRAARTTLIFRPSNWKLTADADVNDMTFTGMYIDMTERAVHYGTTSGKTYVLQLQTVDAPIAVAF